MAPASDEYGSGSVMETTPEWRVFLLFIAIVFVDLIWETIDHHITAHYQRKSKGLLHVWEKLKFEIMALGMVSLLLVVFEEDLLKICVSVDTDDAYDDEETKGALSPGSGRRLLAAEADCPDGQEPLWPSALIHKVHVLIFLIAIAHLLYAGASLALSRWSISRWKHFEEQARSGDLLPLPISQMRKEGENKFVFGVRQCIRQFTHPIDAATYVALRTMFFEQTQLGGTFNFADFVGEFLANEFSKIIHLEFMMWLLAGFWILLPEGSDAALWTTGIFLFLSIAAGAKLHSVAADLARYMYLLYYDEAACTVRLPSNTLYTVCGREPLEARAVNAAGPLSMIMEDPIEVGSRLVFTSEPGFTPVVEHGAEVPSHTHYVPRFGAGFATMERSQSRLPPTSESKEGKDAATLPAPASNGNAVTGAVGQPAGAGDGHQPSNTTAVTHVARLIRGHSQKIKKWTAQDFSELFWFRKPQLLLKIFQYSYFETALSFAVLVFALWQHESTLFDGAIFTNETMSSSAKAAITAGLLIVDVCLLVQSAVYVLPVYAITAASVNFDSQDSLLDYARLNGMQVDVMDFWHATDSSQLATRAPFANRSQAPSQQPRPPPAAVVELSGKDCMPSAAASMSQQQPSDPAPRPSRQARDVAMPVKQSQLARHSSHAARTDSGQRSSGSGNAPRDRVLARVSSGQHPPEPVTEHSRRSDKFAMPVKQSQLARHSSKGGASAAGNAPR